ncbi:SDR family oxidoreductase [Kribbella sp. NPDC000426]|uniref:SDR family oxidoreductase n=1 Tax=Kribbella sp. NPDC000426 TaxID=3154255 RepID=UPI003328502D
MPTTVDGVHSGAPCGGSPPRCPASSSQPSRSGRGEANLLLGGGFRTPRHDAVEAAKAERAGRSAADIQAEEAAQVPTGRLGAVPEFAAVGAFLCSDRASYRTGTAVRCDGGLVHSL